MTALILAMLLWMPAPDIDAPKVYHKTCIYCQDCKPIDVNEYWGDYAPLWRCQRTKLMMAFDSVGVVEWGKLIMVDTTYYPAPYEIRMMGVRTSSRFLISYTSTIKSIDTTVVIDTAGIVRLK